MTATVITILTIVSLGCTIIYYVWKAVRRIREIKKGK